jgi:hypothetical protein
MLAALTMLFRWLRVAAIRICFIIIMPLTLIVSVIQDRDRKAKIANDFLSVVECHRCDRYYYHIDTASSAPTEPVFCGICTQAQEQRTG